MRDELREAMARRGLDFAIVSGTILNNPAIPYLLNGVQIFNTLIIIPRGGKPILFYNDMERDDAELTGFDLVNYKDLPIGRAFRATKMAHEREYLRLKTILDHVGVHGRVGLYAVGDVRRNYFLWRRIIRSDDRIELVEESGADLFEELRLHKDEEEIGRIRSCGDRAIEVFKELEAYLSRLRIEDGRLVKQNGAPATVGDAKRLIAIETVRRGMVVDQDTIFAPGRAAGVPHNHGAASDILRPGETIVCDYFPRDPVTGYCFDMTRTYCVEGAPGHVLAAYDLVKRAQETVIGQVAPGDPINKYENIVCDMFEAAGHPTLRSEPGIDRGFCHSLGHGIGMNIHEAPVITGSPSYSKRVEPGMVFTIEPGLYYPGEGWGIRLEDIVAVHPDGAVENLTRLHKTLIIRLDDDSDR